MRHSLRLTQVLFLAATLIGFFTLIGCGGGGGGGGDGVAATTTTTTSGDVSVSGVVSDSTTSTSIRQAIRNAVASGATITCRYYDDNGAPQTIATQTTTNANGEYTISGLERGLTNVIIEAELNGATFSVVVPALPETGEASKTAMAPVMNPDTGKQTQLVDASMGLGMKPKEVNLGEVFAVLPPEAIAKLSQEELKKIATQMQLRDAARKLAISKFDISSSVFEELRKYAMKLAQEMQEQIAQGNTDYLNEDWSTLFNQKMEEKATALGLSGDAWMALRQIDTDSFAENIKTEFANKTEIQDSLQKLESGNETQKFQDVFFGLMQALKELQSDAGLTDGEIESIAAMLQGMREGLAQASDKGNYMGSHPSAAVIMSVMQKIFKALGLFEGTPPLIAQLGPKPGDATAKGIWEPPTTPTANPVPPTPAQMLAFQDFVRTTIFANIKNNTALMNKLGSNDVKIRALFFLLFGPKEIGFDASQFAAGNGGGTVSGTTGNFTAMNSEIMGIMKKLATPQVVNGQDYAYTIEPPADHPAAPADWNGLLGLLRADTGVTLTESASTNVKDSYIVKVEMEAPPASGRAPAFKVLGVQLNQFTGGASPIEFKQPVNFFGLLVKKGEAYYIVDPADTNAEKPFFQLSLSGDLLTKADSLLNQLVKGSGDAKPPEAGKTYAVVVVGALDKSGEIFVQKPTTVPTTPIATSTTPIATPTTPITPIATPTTPIATPTTPIATPSTPIATSTTPVPTGASAAGFHGPIAKHPTDATLLVMNQGGGGEAVVVPADKTVFEALAATIPTGAFISVTEGVWISQAAPMRVYISKFTIMQ